MDFARWWWRIVSFALAAGIAAACYGQSTTWKPEKNVELIVGTSPGGGQDRTARVIQRIIQDRNLVDAPTAVVNRPGGGGAVALAYSHQRKGDAHFLQIASPTLITNHLTGKSQYNWPDFSPIAIMFTEAIVFAVKADSPMRTGADLIAQLKKDPAAVPISTSTSAGNQYHIASVLVGRAAGVPASRLKIVIYNSGGDAITALLGGHVAVTTASASNFVGHIKSGALRAVAVSAPQRLPGDFANVPTWKELGVNLTLDQWRLVFGPPGLTPAQIAYWEGVLGRVVKSDEWKQELQRNLWHDAFQTSADAKKFLAAEFAEIKAVLTEIGLAK
ncbi:MAG: tripartite tricarboxylate transporter substrate binding protein [Rhodospirillaceae bacterium]